MSKALEGVRILEVASWLSGPTAGYMLGDLGAEVIKIEDPVKGDPLRALADDRPGQLPGGRVLGFEHANRNKKGMTLDLRYDKGREVLYRLVAKSDVFLTSFSKDVLRKLAVDYPTLRKHNPRLIYAYGTGWGMKGPSAGRRAFDFLVQGPSGLMWNVGDRESQQPSSLVGGIIDIGGGTMLAYAILAALVARERLGVGQEVATSLLGTALHLQGMNVNTTFWMGRPMRRNSRTKILNALTTYYRCADGKWLVLCEMQFDQFWGEFCNATGVAPGLVRSVKGGEELVAELDRVFASKTRDEWFRIFQEKGCRFAYGPVNTLPEAVAEPDAVENEHIIEFNHPTMGVTKTIGFPAWLSETPCAIQRPAPEFGQHTEDILLDLGQYSRDEIVHLRAEGVI